MNLGPSVNSEWEDGRACLSADGLALFFASTRPSGLGKHDLWMSTRRSKAEPFGQPVNLGATVDTGYEDLDPWLFADDRALYFQSDRPGSQGGRNLWQTSLLPPGAATATAPSSALGPQLAAFVKEVAALPAEQQVARVVTKLKELNPGYDGQAEHKIENGVVVELLFSTVAVADISPVRALSWLKIFTCSADKDKRSEFCDLSPLRGLQLRKVDCVWTAVKDLTPLRGMPLQTVHINGCPISDLTPLEGSPLENLSLWGTGFQDLNPLRRFQLQMLNLNGCPVSDLAPLTGMPLTNLNLAGTKVRDLTPLQGMPLTWLACDSTDVADLSPLRDAPLQTLTCEAAVALQPANAKILRSAKTLQTINDPPAAAFWKQADADTLPQAKR